MSEESREGKPAGTRRLLEFAGKRRSLTYLGCVLSAVSMILGFGPYICIWMVARKMLSVAPDWQLATGIPVLGWWALGLSVASILIYFVALMCTHIAAFRTATNIRKQCTHHLAHSALGYFDANASGSLRRVIDGCAASTEGLLAHKLPDAAGSIAMLVGVVVILFVFDWRMGLACLVAAALSFCCIFAMMGGRGRDFMMRYQQALVRMSKTGTEYVRGIPVVKVFQQTVYSFRAFREAISDYSEMAENYAVKNCRLPQVLQLCIVNGLVIFLVPTVLVIAPGASDFASFMANFAFYAIFSGVIPTAMTRMMFIAEEMQLAQDAVGRIESVLAAPVMETPAIPYVMSDNSVRFEHVTFSYPGSQTPALDDVSFEVLPGQTVALVGPSGGGKSTAASMVPRFWDVQSGRVVVGGADVRNLNPHDLMDNVAFVFQDSRLFSRSILDNVRAARPSASEEDVTRALSAARCDDIVERLPQGINTKIGTEGTYLSGGEQQRISLARAILKDAPIVVLDEATAFADPENEVLIQGALANLAKGKTVLMIAHRLSTVVGADRIVVLDKGRVAESGTHEELVGAGGVYARMWDDYQRAVEWKIANLGGEGR